MFLHKNAWKYCEGAAISLIFIDDEVDPGEGIALAGDGV
jgi:hypothetical protein